MTEERRLTVTEYTTAFETWATASKGAANPKITTPVEALLHDGIAHVRAAFPDDEKRAPDAYCEVFAAFLSERTDDDRGEAASRLSLTIRKSCLLKRLIYGGEVLRTRKCPTHDGRWRGIFFDPCPHGCDLACGCATGWLPDDAEIARQRAVLAEREAARAAAGAARQAEKETK